MIQICINLNFSALAVTLKQAQTKEFKDYQLQVLANAKVMANELMNHGYTLATGENFIIFITNFVIVSFYSNVFFQYLLFIICAGIVFCVYS